MYRILFSALLISASLPTHLLAKDGPGNRDELPTKKITRKLFQANVGGSYKVLTEYEYTIPYNGVHITVIANNVSYYSRFTDENGNRLPQLYVDQIGAYSQAKNDNGNWSVTKGGTISRENVVSLKLLQSLDKDYVASHKNAKPMKHKKIKIKTLNEVHKAWEPWSHSLQ